MFVAAGGGTEQVHPRNFTWRGKDRTIQYCIHLDANNNVLERLEGVTKCDILNKLSN